MNMNRLTNLCVSVSVMTLSACATTTASGPVAEARLEAKSGSQVAGTVRFGSAAGKVIIEANVTGLTPGEHGFHVHESGDCSAADGSSAKGHFNPGGKKHGRFDHVEHHSGDMPNLAADASGKATLRVELDQFTIDAGPAGIVGRSVVIHADPDDYQSQPAGNSGKRIACGTIALR